VTESAIADTSRRSIGRGATSGATFTLASRLSGLARVGVSAAVLGPTFFGNIFQSVNTLPNLVVSSLGWSVVSPLLVPVLVRVSDRFTGREARSNAERLAGGFLTAQLFLLAAAAAVLLMGAGPISRLLTLGVKDPAAAASIRHAAVVLVLLVGPQVLMYGVIGVSSAVQHAAGRFALPAGAPVVENVGVIIALAVTANRFGTGNELASHAGAASVWLGIGSTVAVVAHAALQWFGAYRSGIVVRPRWAFADPELRSLLRMAPASVVSTALVDLRYLAIAVACSTVAGGFVAFQIALQFAFFVPALFGRPVGTALLGPLRLDIDAGDRAGFAVQYRTGLRIVRLFSIPAGAALVVFSGQLARVVSVGAMGTTRGVNLVRVSILMIGLSVIAESAYEVSRHASFARGNVSAPLRATLLRCAVMAGGLVAGVMFATHHTAAQSSARGVVTVALLGLTVTLADTVSAVTLHRMVHRPYRDIPVANGTPGALRPLVGAVLGAAAVGLAIERAVRAGIGIGRIGGLVTLIAAAGAFGAVYFGWILRSGVGTWLRAEWSGATREPTPVVTGAHAHTDDDGFNDSATAPLPPPQLVAVAHLPVTTMPTGDRVLIGALVAFTVALVVGVLAAIAPLAAIALAAVSSVCILVITRPAWAVYLYLGAFPFLAGIDRGRLVPVLRATEALQLLVTVAALVGLVGRLVRNGRDPSIRIGPVDVSFVAMAVTGSVLPVAWLAVRNEPLTSADLMACLPLWRYLGLYVLVRSVMRTRDEMRRAATVVLATACGVAIIGIAQSFNVPGVRNGLVKFWSSSLNPNEAANGRASTTFASPIATATFLSLSFGLALALLVGSKRRSPAILRPVAVLLFIGAASTGQVSAVLALFVVTVVTAAMAGRLGLLVRWAVPALAVLSLVLWPIVQRRLGDVDNKSGLPQSWVVRIDNLRTLYLPEFHGLRWLFGVRPDSVATPLDRGRQVAFLESGYLSLLWIGGIPLLISYVGFVVASTRSLLQRPRLFDYFGRSVTIAAVSSVTAIAVLNFTDAHLTFRGGADVTFVLLAIAVAARAQKTPVAAIASMRDHAVVAA
jgi:peptidoglycan biosynthesis protein MviN/MurJ (putative lipid II flippase)